MEYPTFGTGLGVNPYVDGAGLPLYVIEQVNDMSKVGDRAILVSPKKEAHHVGIVIHNYRSRITPLGMRIVAYDHLAGFELPFIPWKETLPCSLLRDLAGICRSPCPGFSRHRFLWFAKGHRCLADPWRGWHSLVCCMDRNHIYAGSSLLYHELVSLFCLEVCLEDEKGRLHRWFLAIG